MSLKLTTPNTTKGDLIVRDDSSPGIDDRLGVGSDGQVLTADSGEAQGMLWADPATGDVVGPASATDSVPALFDGTTGKLLKNSTPTGTGAPVLATSPTLVTPALGTPSAGNLANCTAYEGTALASTGEGGGTKFLREDGDGTCSWQAVSGSGDVVGPASATDSVPALFDGTTGKLIKNSTPTGTGNPVLATGPTLVLPIISMDQTITTNGQVTIDTSIPQFCFQSGGTEYAMSARDEKGLVFVNAASGDEATIYYSTSLPITGLTVKSVCRGTSPSVAFEVRYASDRSAAGTLVASGTTTSTTTVETDTFTSAIAQANTIWVELDTVSGTVDEFFIQIQFYFRRI